MEISKKGEIHENSRTTSFSIKTTSGIQKM